MANQKSEMKKTTPTASPEIARPESSQQWDASKEDTDLARSASGLIDQAKTAAGDTFNAVTEKASEAVEERKSNISEGLSTVAESVRSAGDELRSTGAPNRVTELTAQFSGSVADRLESAARYFQQHDMSAMMRDAQDLARRNPALFIGGAFVAGMLAARFLKSSASSDSLTGGDLTGDPSRPTSKPAGQPTAGRQFRQA